jgi:hypothetical protein
VRKRALLIGLVVFCVFGLRPWRIFAQAGAGYTKIASTNGLSQIDTAVASGQVFNYVVTAFNASGESGPSNVVTAIIPSTAVTHSVSLSWTAPVASPTGGVPTGYNVYRELVVLPNPPGALTETTQ